MKIVLIGGPGAGKGTQAAKLSELLKVPHISTGDIFRDNIKKSTPLGVEAESYISKGMLVPDEVTMKMVKARLQMNDCSDGYILDGFPRTIPQAEFLDSVELEQADFYVINIEVDDEIIIDRLCGRRVCPKCGATFHVKYNKPIRDGICDICSEHLVQREDDVEKTIKNRLNVYHEQTEPLLKYYSNRGKLYNSMKNGNVDDTYESIKTLLGV